MSREEAMREKKRSPYRAIARTIGLYILLAWMVGITLLTYASYRPAFFNLTNLDKKLQDCRFLLKPYLHNR